MDEHYDINAAGFALQDTVSERTKVGDNLEYVFQLWDFDASQVRVRARGGGFIHAMYLDLARRGEEQDVVEPYFRIQGVLGDKLLPPVSKPNNRASMLRSRRHMRQEVRITGLGQEYFERALTTIEEFYMLFYQHVDEDKMELWQPASVLQYQALDSFNKYFTPGHVRGQGEPVPFSTYADPDGILGDLVDNDFVHTSDNHVDYFQRTEDEEGVRYNKISPTMFKVGDIVEATVSFVCARTKDSTFKLHIILRGLTLLDSAQRNAAALKRMKSRMKNATVFPHIKRRRALYTEQEEVAETQKKMAKLHITNQDDMES